MNRLLSVCTHTADITKQHVHICSQNPTKKHSDRGCTHIRGRHSNIGWRLFIVIVPVTRRTWLSGNRIKVVENHSYGPCAGMLIIKRVTVWAIATEGPRLSVMLIGTWTISRKRARESVFIQRQNHRPFGPGIVGIHIWNLVGQNDGAAIRRIQIFIQSLQTSPLLSTAVHKQCDNEYQQNEQQRYQHRENNLCQQIQIRPPFGWCVCGQGGGGCWQW